MLWRELAADNPTRHTPDIARSLNNLGISLRRSGDRSEAVRVEAEAVAYWWHLTQLRPGEFENRYTGAQRQFVRTLAENGHDAGEAWTAELAARARIAQY